MAGYSPYEATPGADDFYYADKKFPSPSPTPSPRGPGYNHYFNASTPVRPATRAHFRGQSTSGFQGNYPSPRGPSFSPRYTSDGQYATANAGPYTFDREAAGFATPRYEPERERKPAPSHTRRSSTAAPPRPQTARPSSSHVHKKPLEKEAKRAATELDAKRHRIPAGYSLKNWDPNEEPIMLLGSVFDANSLGKWIYDWTVYHHGPATPISDMAGDLWLLLIKLSGKIKRAEDIVPKIRSKDNREMVEEFIEAGDRLTDKLRKLLKTCEAPMLQSSKQRKSSQLGKNAGVEFVETMFGRERELEKTERFMASVRLWNLRFDTNCEEILRKPTM